MIVMLDEAADLPFELVGRVIVVEQNAVLQGLVPTLDLVLGLGVIRGAAHVLHALVFKPPGQIVRDVTRSIVAEKPRPLRDGDVVTRVRDFAISVWASRVPRTPRLLLCPRFRERSYGPGGTVKASGEAIPTHPDFLSQILAQPEISDSRGAVEQNSPEPNWKSATRETGGRHPPKLST